MQNTVLWVYIVLLLLGGLMGYFKGKSKVSLFMSVAFAVPLILCALGRIAQPNVANILLTALLIVFVIRLARTKKFMPAGFMTVITILALAIRNLRLTN